MRTRTRSSTVKPIIIIDGDVIEPAPDRVSIHDLSLDADNPRIRYLVKSHGLTSPTQDQLKELLWQVSGVQELARKIRVNGGTIDPIVVKEDGTVIEGNCRLSSYRHLHQGDPQSPSWRTIPVLRLPRVTQKQIDILLSKYHVSGKIGWRTYAQAGQIYKLRHEHRMQEEEITRVTGIANKEVKDLLRTYEVLTNHILPTLPGAKGLKKFSHVYEFFKNPDPELQRLRAKKGGVEEFAGWVVEGKIRKGADVRELPGILRTPAALTTLRSDKEGGKKALGMVVRPSEFTLLNRALEVLGGLRPALITRLKSDRAEQKLLRDLHSKIEDVAGLANVALR